MSQELTLQDAQKFLQHNNAVNLSEFKSIADAAAEALAKHKGTLWLDGLTTLSDAAAEALAKHKHEGILYLSGLTTLSDAAAEALAKREGTLYLSGLTTLSDAAAEALAKHEGTLYLSGLTTLSDAAAEALAKHEGALDLDGVAKAAVMRARKKLKQGKYIARRTALQETGTTYANSISGLLETNLNFWSIYENNVNQTTHLRYGQIFDSLDNGLAIIDDHQTLLNYIACYGGHHYHKLQTSFDALFPKIPANSNIEIIDYGCGQGLATTAFYDYMLRSTKNFAVENIILIEPSLLSLKRGILHLNHFINHKQQDTEIKRINKMLDDVTETELRTSNPTIKVHLFSNILDVTTFDLSLLARKIENAQKGINYFVCVSPDNLTAEERIFNFKRSFAHTDITDIPSTSQQILGKVYNFTKKQWQDDYKITICQSIFKCNFGTAT